VITVPREWGSIGEYRLEAKAFDSYHRVEKKLFPRQELSRSWVDPGHKTGTSFVTALVLRRKLALPRARWRARGGAKRRPSQSDDRPNRRCPSNPQTPPWPPKSGLQDASILGPAEGLPRLHPGGP
jgi:hypothetical protein